MIPYLIISNNSNLSIAFLNGATSILVCIIIVLQIQDHLKVRQIKNNIKQKRKLEEQNRKRLNILYKKEIELRKEQLKILKEESIRCYYCKKIISKYEAWNTGKEFPPYAEFCGDCARKHHTKKERIINK